MLELLPEKSGTIDLSKQLPNFHTHTMGSPSQMGFKHLAHIHP